MCTNLFRQRVFKLALVLPILVAGGVARAQQQDFRKVEIKTEQVADTIYVLFGAGGNIGVSVGADGTFIIDDQYAPLTEKILAAVEKLTNKPVRFVVNTHWHGDHTGGNENLGNRGATIVAHKNVLQRLSTEQKIFGNVVPPAPAAARPVITFRDDLTFHWNGEEIHVFHVANAHTDGDAALQFRKSNVLHTGDTWFNGFYPFIDVGSGGSIDGYLAALDTYLAITDADTRIIPGHGALGGKADLQRSRDVIAASAERVRALKAQGKTREEVIAAKPMAEWDAQWGSGFINAETWAGIVYDATR